MFSKLYSRIAKIVLRRRYRKLYRRLFWHYARKLDSADEAGMNAAAAFEWITLHEWPEWARLNLPEFSRQKEK